MYTKFLQVHVRIFVKTIFTTGHFVTRTKLAPEWHPIMLMPIFFHRKFIAADTEL